MSYKENNNLDKGLELRFMIQSTLSQIHRLLACDAVAYIDFSETNPEIFCVYPSGAHENIDKLWRETILHGGLGRLLGENNHVLLERCIDDSDVFIHSSSSTQERPTGVIFGILQKDKQTQYMNNIEVLNAITVTLNIAVSSQLKLTQVQAINTQLRQQNIDLSHEVRQTKEALQLASNAKTGFCATFSQELRTPLNAVMGMLHLLGDSDLDNTQTEYVDIAKQSGESFLDLINNVLDINSIEAGNLEIKNDNFLLWDTVESVISSFSDSARSKGLELSCYLAYDVPFAVSGDDKCIKQLLVNLIGNAIKFTECGEVALLVTVDSVTDSSALLRFRIRDTGIGVQQESIKEILHRQDAGTGLGLMICSRLVEAMGGEIGVDCIANNGSVFWFTLEMELGVGGEGFQPNKNLLAKRALIIDDRASSAAVVQHRLIDWGMEARFVTTAKHAIQFSQNSLKDLKPYDIIFINMALAEKPACEVISALEVIHAEEPMVYIGLTHSVSKPIKLETKHAMKFIESPVRYKQLHDCLVSALNGAENNNIQTEPLATNKQLLSGANILIFENNVVDQKVVEAILKKFECVFDFADSGEMAIEKIKQTTYDAILMDYHSLIVDGFQIMHRIREIETASKLPIIALAAHTLNNVKKECLESGMDDFISKPINPHVLYRKLSDHIHPENFVHTENLKDLKSPAKHVQSIDNSDDGLNHKVLDKLQLLLGKEGYKGLIDSYILRATTHIQSARQHIDLGDMEQLHFVAHTLKGSSANLGVSDLAALSASLDDLALQVSPIPELYQQLDLIEKQFAKIEMLLLKNLKKRVS